MISDKDPRVRHICDTPRCDRPADAVICHGCQADLVRSLRQLARGPQVDGQRRPGLVEELQVTITRQSVWGGGTGIKTRLAERPLPYHQEASTLGDKLRNALTTWARVVLDKHPHLSLADTTSQGIAGWLSRLPSLLAMLPGAGQMVQEITRLTDSVSRMVDRSPDRVYLGICSEVTDGIQCPEDLYALPTRATVRCRTCGTEHHIEARRAILLAAVDDQLATAVEVSRALPGLIREDLNVNTVRSWAKRRMLSAKGRDSMGRPLYRIGDVLELWRRSNTRAS